MARKQVLMGALVLGFAGGVVSRYLFRERDQTEQILSLVLDVAEIQHKLETIEGKLEDLSRETALLIAGVTTELQEVVARLGTLEDRIAALRNATQPENQLSQSSEESELEAPSFEILDFHVETKDGGVLVLIGTRNTADVVATFMPFVRCNEGPKYLWHYSAGSTYLAPGEQDQLSYDPYMSLEPGSYTFTLTHMWIEAISEEGKRIGSWKVPLEGYVDTLVVEREQEG